MVGSFGASDSAPPPADGASASSAPPPSGANPPKDPLATVALVLAILGLVVWVLVPALAALGVARRSEKRIVFSRGALGGRDRIRTAQRLGRIGVFLGIIGLTALLLFSLRDGLADVRAEFFDWSLIRSSFPEILDAFWLNVKMFMIAEVFVLIWGLTLALMRRASGPAAPLKWFSIVYVDVFRGIPGILVIALVGFGLPTAGVVGGDFDIEWLGIIALTVIYGAYVAEVYRAGIESVHASQFDAARSLGLSQSQAMGSVVVPQAVRRVIPPLMNDFISLQKDTALVSTIGVFEAFRQGSVIAGNHFNYSPMIGVAFCFLVITVPMTRFVDWRLERDQRRRLAGS